MTTDNSPLFLFKQFYSTCLVIFSVVIVTALMFTENTKVAADAHPVVALVVMWLGILWMSMVEGGQCSMVGLPPIDRELYKDSHKITYQICSLGHKGDNLDRYLMGRQFMVIFINFTISLCGSPLDGATVLGLPQWVSDIFLGSGIAMVLTNVNIGQLTAQVNASHCMLDYINTHFMTFTLYATLLIEMSGFMHVCYLIRDLVHYAAGKEVQSNEPPKTGLTGFFHYGRVIFSMVVLGFCLAVTIEAILQEQTTMWDVIPPWLAVIIFFVLISLVGLLEAMQIAFFAVAKMRVEDRGDHPVAKRTCELLFKNGGRNLPGFMVGRQVTVTLIFFVAARATTLNIKVGEEPNIFGVSDGLQEFFNLGFLGAILTTILGSISWQLVASAFPIAFLSNPFVFIMLNLVLLIEATGICAAAWFFGSIHKKVAGFQLDEVYVGTAEERAAGGKPDTSMHPGRDFSLGTNVLVGNPATWEEAIDNLSGKETPSQKRERMLANIKGLRELAEGAEGAEKEAYDKAIELELKALDEVNSQEEDAKKTKEAASENKADGVVPVDDLETGAA